MNLQAWGAQRAQYSRARHGRDERGAAVVECALIQATAEAMAVRMRRRRQTSSQPTSTAA